MSEPRSLKHVECIGRRAHERIAVQIEGRVENPAALPGFFLKALDQPIVIRVPVAIHDLRAHREVVWVGPRFVVANHVGGIQTGEVLAKATLVHGGKTTHLWSIEVREKDTERLICTGKHTVMVLEKME